jgi:hypothetical protein
MRKKKCSICKDKKFLRDFNKKKSSPDGKQTHCRECNKKRSQKYYACNKEKHKRVVEERKWKVIHSNQQYIYNLTKEKGCVDCGEKDPVVLEFDHIKGKKRDCVSKMLLTGCSLQTLLKEIRKCVIRCANCHRRKTAKDQNWYCNIDTGS